jgi:nucleoside phosphorylase
MTPSKALSPTSRKEFEIAIICAKSLEYDTICILLDGFWDKEGDSFGRAKGDPNTYTTGYIGKFNVVVVLLCNSGQATAASAAASLRSSYPCVELLLLIGTCEGVPNIADTSEEELLQGDVIISETVVEYDLSSHYEGLQERDTIDHYPSRANKNIRSFITLLKTETGCQRLREKAASNLRRIQSRPSSTRRPQRRKVITYEYPGSASDMLFEPTYCHRHYHSSECECAGYLTTGDPVCDGSRVSLCSQTGCENIYLVHRARLDEKQRLEQESDFEAVQKPQIFFGRFGSSNTTINSGTVRDLIARKHNVIAFEVEAAGVWDELPCIIVKGLSGYGDGHKPKNWESWQNFATATSAAVAKGLIESYTLTDHSPAAEAEYQRNLNCLRSLFITNPRDDKIRIRDTKGGLLFDAYKWILDNEAYQEWCGDSEANMLWIQGDPGKGKTMLLCGIIEELEKESSRNIYYFFCQATESRLSNATAILRGLLYMLLCQQPILIAYVSAEYETSGKTIFEDSNSCTALLRIFSSILSDPSMKEAIFVIDALDECLTDLPQLLGFFAQTSRSWPHIRWLV